MSRLGVLLAGLLAELLVGTILPAAPASAWVHRSAPPARPHAGTPAALPTLDSRPGCSRAERLAGAPAWCRSLRRRSADPGSAARPRPDVPGFARAVPAGTTQVVRTISSTRWCRKAYCTLTQAWQKDATGWHLVRQFRSTIGAKGWGKRREGDNRSPVGVFRIKVTFSTGSKAPGPMPWRRRKPTSVVSAAHGANYNTWVEVPGVRSGNRPSMRWGWVVDYNRVRLTPGRGPRPVPGRGSGIFYHTSKPGHRWAPTAGCTQLGSPQAMRWLVRWLRPGANPRVVQRL